MTDQVRPGVWSARPRRAPYGSGYRRLSPERSDPRPLAVACEDRFLALREHWLVAVCRRAVAWLSALGRSILRR